MSTAFTVRTLRTASIAAAAAGTSYAGVSYYQRRSILATVYAEAPGPKKATWSGFTELKLESSEQVNNNVKKLRFVLPDPDSVSGLAPVSSLLSKHTPDGAWIPVIRPYTPVSDNDDPGHVAFLIKAYPNGKGSGKMHSLTPGDTMTFKPLAEYPYTPNTHTHYTLIAGGSGITPLYQLTRTILRNPNDTTKVTLIYGNNSDADILLRPEFDQLEMQYPGRFKATYTVSKADASHDASKTGTGYVDKAMLLKAMPVKGEAGSVKVLVSGPPAMTEAIAGAKGGFGWTQGSIGGVLKELGYTKEDVHKF